eukprot:TRINITY_DN23861_c0_g1_i1.p1 TRINITY_DN23861_c0_g1~~TRINITY_DN23861_c0_g1_i1.p1  ORF type:complete len:373 (-),score=44.82 TRINITY_DN23861_c0_g1_i1:187-1305(-)
MSSQNPAQKSLAYGAYTCLTPGNLLRLAYQPKVYVTLLISLPCGLFGGALRFMNNQPGATKMENFLKDDSVFTMLTILVTFLAAFRVSAAYQKFWDGCDEVYNIIGNFYDATTDLIAFTRNAEADPQEVKEFHHLLIRMVSLLVSVVFADLEGGHEKLGEQNAYDFEVIDIAGLDPEGVERLMASSCKVEVVYQWILNLLVESWQKKIFSVEAPLMSRPLSDLSKGLVHFHEAQRITEVPFPFPLNLALQLLLITHWLLTPLVVSSWTSYTVYAFAFCFGYQFSLWFFVALAIELDTPFSHTRNSLDIRYLQQLHNNRLLTAMEANAKPQPKLCANVNKNLTRCSLTEQQGASAGLAVTVSRRSLASGLSKD